MMLSPGDCLDTLLYEFCLGLPVGNGEAPWCDAEESLLGGLKFSVDALKLLNSVVISRTILLFLNTPESSERTRTTHPRVEIRLKLESKRHSRLLSLHRVHGVRTGASHASLTCRQPVQAFALRDPGIIPSR
jgi:hypothetical protein